MDLFRLRGSRRPRQQMSEGERHSTAQMCQIKVVGRCRICGQSVRWAQSHHRGALGLAHLCCE